MLLISEKELTLKFKQSYAETSLEGAKSTTVQGFQSKH